MSLAFLLLLNVRVILALLFTEVNFAFGTLSTGLFFFSDRNLSQFDTMPIGVIHNNDYM